MDGFGPPPPGKVIRAPSLKRGRADERISDRIKLERVLGVTVSSNAALDSDPNTESVAYPAGCTVVLFNTQTGHQSHIINSSRKTITSLAFSSCGRYLVTGECGHQPAVRVWDLQSDLQPGPPGVAPQVQQVAEFLSHKYGISCVAFSPSSKYVVSIGTQHDMIVNVWDWKNNIKVASNKVSTKVKALAFAENGSYFVTVGNRHVKFWFLEYGKAKYKEAVPLMGRSAILGEQRNNYFCDVACGKAQCGDSTYAITRSGLLCEFNNRRLLDKWVELRTSSANCIAVGETYIFVGCAEGIVRCFDPATLRFVTTLPRTHYLGVDVSQGLNITHMSSPPPDAKYPDTVAITYDETSKKLTCIYNDHSVYVWDIHNIKRVGKSHSFLYHSACIWGVEMSPPNSPLPPGSFLTCSSDDTIRVWTLDKLNDKNSRGMYQRNIYSNELLKVVYIDTDMAYLKDLDLSTTNSANDKTDGSYDGRNGVRAIRISPDGKNLASGDRAGNIRIHETKGMTEECKIEAHDAEVLCLEYTQTETDQKLLASASRDRLIHVFDVNKGYNFLQTLDDHSSSITAVRFLNIHGNLQMVSCGADKSLIFRSLGEVGTGAAQFARGHNATGKTTLYDMEIDSGQKHVLTACQDRNVRIYSVGTGKHTRVFKGSTGDDGTLIKVTLDHSGIYLATSCTDKSLSVYDYYTGECMATMCGHSELATGLRFTNDCRRLISASGDGCIFVWRVPHDMVVTMHARLSQQAMRQGKTLDNEIFTDSSSVDFYDPNANSVENDYRFSIGALPLWAKKHISDDTSPPTSLTKGVAAPKGRWAQRAERSVGMKSIYTDSIISFPSLHDRRGDSDEKDSSLDSGTETRHYSEMRRDTKMTSKQITSSSISITSSREGRRNILTDDSALGGSVRDTDIESTAHDADIDSDQEYRHQPLYYPTQHDSASGSEFTITNMDADELRRSQRKSKRGNLPAIAIQPTSISGSQDSDDDDDEVSTPSGENTDRNPMSILSVSSESLDQIVNREKYLQSTFESLSGVEMEASPANKSSISSQYLTRTNGTLSTRNIAVINAAKQIKHDSEASKKREELAKRIAATRKKLQSVGYSSPLKYSQSIHDLSHIPEKDKWNSANRKQEIDSSQEQTFQLPSSFSLPSNLQLCGCYMKDIVKNTNFSFLNPAFGKSSGTTDDENLIGSSVKLSDLNRVPEKVQKYTGLPVRPRKLHLDKTLAKYKLNKSLPVSPVNEERSFSDFVQRPTTVENEFVTRRSFSYFIDFEQKNTMDEGFRKICSDIEKFSQDISKKNDQIDLKFAQKVTDNVELSRNEFYNENEEREGSFSSDSLEDCSFNSTQNRKSKKYKLPRRCLSNNEIYKYQLDAYQCDIPKSESFYLNPSNKNSQDSILSDENQDFDIPKTKSYCNSLESVLSCESDCKSAPLEVLFSSYRKPRYSDCNDEESHFLRKGSTSKPNDLEDFGGSLPKNYNTSFENYPRTPTRLKTSQTQTDFTFETPHEIVSKKPSTSSDFQEKLLKFETCIAQNDNFNVQHSLRENKRKAVAFFVETEHKNNPQDVLQQEHKHPESKQSPREKQTNEKQKQVNVEKQNNRSSMCIPTLDMKNKQYESKFCNVLNNKPDFNIEIYESGGKVPTGKSNENIFVLTEKNSSGNRNQIQETSSLDRHLFTKNLLEGERVAHKPPKGVRRNSSKSRKSRTTYEYIRKDDFLKKINNVQNSKKNDPLNNSANIENEADCIEFSYKEKNVERECENGNSHREETKILHELYDSLDKIEFSNKIECDSLEVNINRVQTDDKIFDSLEYNPRNIWGCNSKHAELNVWKNNREFEKLKLEPCESIFEDSQSDSGFSKTSLENFSSGIDRIQFALENIKILNEIQRKISKINTLVDVFKRNMYSGKVRALSQMYETLTNSQSYYNDLLKSSLPRAKFRRRNLSLPNFVERRLNVVNIDDDGKQQNVCKPEKTEVKDSKLSNKKCDCDNTEKISSNKLNSEAETNKIPAEVSSKETGMTSTNITQVHIDAESPDNSLRRACSLSDLSMQGPIVQKRKVEQVSGKLIKHPSTARNNPRYSKNPAITRSSSTGVLNQSDSDNETDKKLQSRLMRPTISSQNKMSTVKNATMRKRQSYSVMNLSTVGQEDSSSEENEKILISKPAVPPRTRIMNENGQGPAVPSRRHTTNKDKSKNNRNSTTYERKKSVDMDGTLTNTLDDHNIENVDVSTVHLSTQLCDEVAFQLTKAANNVVELYKRLTDADSNSPEQLASVQKTDMVKNLEMSIARTLNMLQGLTLEKLKQSNGTFDVHQTNTVKRLNDLVSQGFANDQNTVVSMMQQYSDILLSMMQQKIQNSNT